MSGYKFGHRSFAELMAGIEATSSAKTRPVTDDGKDRIMTDYVKKEPDRQDDNIVRLNDLPEPVEEPVKKKPYVPPVIEVKYAEAERADVADYITVRLRNGWTIDPIPPHDRWFVSGWRYLMKRIDTSTFVLVKGKNGKEYNKNPDEPIENGHGDVITFNLSEIAVGDTISVVRWRRNRKGQYDAKGSMEFWYRVVDKTDTHITVVKTREK